jgi:hypothetical protein
MRFIITMKCITHILYIYIILFRNVFVVEMFHCFFCYNLAATTGYYTFRPTHRYFDGKKNLQMSTFKKKRRNQLHTKLKTK